MTKRIIGPKTCKDCGGVFPLEDFALDGIEYGRQAYRARCRSCSRVKRRTELHRHYLGGVRGGALPALVHPVQPDREPRPIEPRVDQYRIACVVCGYEVFDALTEARMRRLSTACVRCGRCRGPVEFEVIDNRITRTSMIEAHSTTHQPGMAHAWRESMA